MSLQLDPDIRKMLEIKRFFGFSASQEGAATEPKVAGSSPAKCTFLNRPHPSAIVLNSLQIRPSRRTFTGHARPRRFLVALLVAAAGHVGGLLVHGDDYFNW
jgi:hypothetical protein